MQASVCLSVSSPVSSPGPILRAYQLAAIDAANAAVARGVRRFILEMPTASGKTATFSAWAIRDFLPRGRVLVLVPTDETVRQAVEAFSVLVPPETVGVVKAERDEHARPVVVASVATLARPDRLRRVAQDFALVIVDEAHHSAAETYRRILAHVATGGTVVSGWTATAFRADRQDLVGPTGVFQELALELPIVPMIREGWLSDVLVKRYRLGFDLDTVTRHAGDYSARSLADVMLASDPLPHVIAAYRNELAGKRAIAYTPTIAMAVTLAEAFRAAGVPAECLSGDTPTVLRRAVLARFRAGETLVVTNASVLSEGFDEPRTEGIILLRPTLSRVLLRQLIGRGFRTYPGKLVCKILDFSGATRRHDLMTVGTALGVSVRDGETVVEAATRADVEAEYARETEAERTRLIADRVELFRQGRAAWSVGMDGQAFALWIGDKLHVDVVPDVPDADGSERWRVILAAPDSFYRPGRRFVAPVDKMLGYGLSLSDAQAMAETYARDIGQGDLVNRQPRTTPASEAQCALWTRHQKRLGPVPEGLTVSGASQGLGGVFAEQREAARQRGTRRVVPAAGASR